MKRLICMVPCLLMLLSAAQAEDWLSIVELQEQTPARWVESIQTPWRTVDVDAAITLPETEDVPVLLIEGGAEVPLLTAEETGWERIQTTYGYKLGWHRLWPDYPAKLDGKRLDSQQTSGTNWYSGIELTGCYVPLSDTTLADICDQVDATLRQFGVDPQDYAYRTPSHMWSQRMLYYGKKQDALPGTLFVHFYAKINEIPVLSHIFESVYTEGGSSRDDEFLLYPTNWVIYHGYGEYVGSISLWRANTVDILAADVPLCPFDAVQAAIRGEIEAGRIRKIYEIELGYVLFNEPGKYRTAAPGDAALAEYAAARYYIKPMWRVNCLYTDSPTAKLRARPSDSDDERNTLDYHQLLIDAQTGEVVGRSNAKDRCEFKGFVDWGDVE